MHSSTVSRNSVAAMFMVSSSEVIGEVPGLQSVAIAICSLVAAQGLDRRKLLLAQHIEGAGQQHRHRAGLRHRSDAGLVGIFEMIGGKRVVARRKRRAVQVGELVGVQLDRQAVRFRGIEHARGLLGREGNALAEARRPRLQDRPA